MTHTESGQGGGSRQAQFHSVRHVRILAQAGACVKKKKKKFVDSGISWFLEA